MIINEIVKKAKDLIKDEDFKILDFSFSLPYSYVLIEKDNKKSLGVAMTLLEEYNGNNCRKDVDIEFKKLQNFIDMAKDFNIINRTLGLAAINAVSQYFIKLNEREYNCDIIDLISKENIKRIAIIGYMSPIVNMLKEKGHFDLYIFERNRHNLSDNTLSDTFEYSLLPEMDAVLISGTSILNNTLDMILDRSKNAKLKILIGPSAQILPELIKDTGINYIASTHILDIDRVVYNLKFGSSYGLFKKYSKKYVIKI